MRGNVEKVKRHLSEYILICCWVPFVIGIIGYMMEGCGFFESMYASAGLYFVSPMNTLDNFLITLAKYTSLIVAASVVIALLDTFVDMINRIWMKRRKDSTAVYCNNVWGKRLVKQLRHGFLAREQVKDDEHLEEGARHHIFMFSDDLDNVSYYTRHKEELRDSKVYIMLNHIDASLLRSAEDSNVHFFNLYDLMARIYWRRHNLYDKVKAQVETPGSAPIHIAFIGDDARSSALLKYAVLNNLYFLDQRIEYHVWDCTPAQKKFWRAFDTMNGDVIVVHDRPWQEELKEISGMERVIITEKNPLVLLQEMLYAMPPVDIHCYNDDMTSLGDLFDSGKLVTFGDMDEILTEDCIKNEILCVEGMLYNYDYNLRFSEKTAPADRKILLAEAEALWVKTAGYGRGSSIAQADHFWVKERLRADGIPDCGELEHLRWRRYLIYNHWTYSADKNKAERKHNLLVPFDQVPPEDRPKNSIYSEAVLRELLACEAKYPRPGSN